MFKLDMEKVEFYSKKIFFILFIYFSALIFFSFTTLKNSCEIFSFDKIVNYQNINNIFTVLDQSRTVKLEGNDLEEKRVYFKLYQEKDLEYIRLINIAYIKSEEDSYNIFDKMMAKDLIERYPELSDTTEFKELKVYLNKKYNSEKFKEKLDKLIFNNNIINILTFGFVNVVVFDENMIKEEMN